MQGETDIKTLEPGSYFSSTGESVHQVSSEADKESIIYVRMEGKFDVIPTQTKKEPRPIRVITTAAPSGAVVLSE